MNPDWIVPDWPAPARVRALVTTRSGGVSAPPYDSFNLGAHVGDEPAAVIENRRRLRSVLPAEPLWLTQVHGTRVVSAEQAGAELTADACVARSPGRICAVQSADCLPLLLCAADGSAVAAAHAGWRGLAAGVLEQTVTAMAVAPKELIAWLGPAIGPAAFEVGAEVREIFCGHDPAAAAAFAANDRGRWQCDLAALARQRLARAGVARVFGGGLCTYADPLHFYSYRRDGVTGRMASLVWLA
ncbi:laccase domain protein YfiH [mine drainage metagenome]|uniref:Laccase domain protein YfiH n=1 Tax=mine drainage metagenome TaxID=410659 RepID=A0A1J5S9X1_9ZZZZ